MGKPTARGKKKSLTALMNSFGQYILLMTASLLLSQRLLPIALRVSCCGREYNAALERMLSSSISKVFLYSPSPWNWSQIAFKMLQVLRTWLRLFADPAGRAAPAYGNDLRSRCQQDQRNQWAALAWFQLITVFRWADAWLIHSR